MPYNICAQHDNDMALYGRYSAHNHLARDRYVPATLK